ncbi:hypothetical protein ABZ797_44345 [Streptomyces antimycoticus]
MATRIPSGPGAWPNKSRSTLVGAIDASTIPPSILGPRPAGRLPAAP